MLGQDRLVTPAVTPDHTALHAPRENAGLLRILMTFESACSNYQDGVPRGGDGDGHVELQVGRPRPAPRHRESRGDYTLSVEGGAHRPPNFASFAVASAWSR